MSKLRENIEFLKSSKKSGQKKLDDITNSVFLGDILEELSVDEANFLDFKDEIPMIYKACMDELKDAPNDVKPLLLSTVIKHFGINNLIKEDLSMNIPVFENYLESKSPAMIYSEVNELFDHAFDPVNKRIDLDMLLGVAKASLKNPDESKDILSIYVNNPNFGDRLPKVLAAVVSFKELSEVGDYELTSNQKSLLDKISEEIIKSRKASEKLNEEIEESLKEYKKYYFTNEKTVESQIHGMKEEQAAENIGGTISSHSIETPVKEVKEEIKANADIPFPIERIEWEEKYQQYLKSLGNVKVMSTYDKFEKRFAAHGFAPATSSLFGDSVISTDKYGDPTKTMWNVSPFTGTMRLGKDVNYYDQQVVAQTFSIAALNARRNGWKSVYLNHPGPDQEAKHFLENSVRAMVEVGNYEYEDIKVPSKYAHILEQLKNEDMARKVTVSAKAEDNQEYINANPDLAHNNRNEATNDAPLNNATQSPHVETDTFDPDNEPDPIDEFLIEDQDRFNEKDFDEKFGNLTENSDNSDNQFDGPSRDETSVNNDMPSHFDDVPPLSDSEIDALEQANANYDLPPDLDYSDNVDNFKPDEKKIEPPKNSPRPPKIF